MKQKSIKILLSLLMGALCLTGCGLSKNQSEDGIEMSKDEMYQLLAENGYGEGVDWSKQTDDDPNISKEMDLTQDKEHIAAVYHEKSKEDLEPGTMYEMAWWEYIPDDYDLSGDVFPETENYAGAEKKYNNSTMQSVVGQDRFTSGQDMDYSEVRTVADSFIYEHEKDRFDWTADLEAACERAEKLDIADFYARKSLRPWFAGGEKDPENLKAPTSQTAYYHVRTVGYDLIGLPKWSGYEFTIDSWMDEKKLVGWVNELEGGKFLNEKEVYENMGEWDFYDNLEASSHPKKVVKPKLPNGANMLKGKTDQLCKEYYIYTKFAGKSGNIYYYGNGLTVDMTFYGGSQGGNFKDALHYCRVICGNE